jgi:hypothetical protein
MGVTVTMVTVTTVQMLMAIVSVVRKGAQSVEISASCIFLARTNKRQGEMLLDQEARS